MSLVQRPLIGGCCKVEEQWNDLVILYLEFSCILLGDQNYHQELSEAINNSILCIVARIILRIAIRSNLCFHAIIPNILLLDREGKKVMKWKLIEM
jgi:hypothetical protein